MIKKTSIDLPRYDDALAEDIEKALRRTSPGIFSKKAADEAHGLGARDAPPDDELMELENKVPADENLPAEANHTSSQPPRLEPLEAAASPDPLASERAEEMVEARIDERLPAVSDGAGGIWWLALAASIIVTGAVVAYAWGANFRLPSSYAEFKNSLAIRDVFRQYVIMGSAILLPLTVIWMLAAVAIRSSQIRAESRALTRQTMRLAEAQSAEPEVHMPSFSGETPANIRREVERATHAIGALHTQMKSIEEALAAQTAALDGAADRAESRARSIVETLRAEREQLEQVVSTLENDGERLNRFIASPAAPPAAEATAPTVAKEQVRAPRAQAPTPSASEDPGLKELRSKSESIEASVQVTTRQLAAISTELQQMLDQLQKHGGGESASVRGMDDAQLEDSINGLAEKITRTVQESNPENLGYDHQSKTGETDPTTFQRHQHLAELKKQVDDLRTPEAGASGALNIAAVTGIAGAAGAALAGGQVALADETSSQYSIGTAANERRELEQVSAPDASPTSSGQDTLAIPAPRRLDWAKLVKAANFPDSQNDHDTLSAFYDVLTDPEAAAMLQSSEDALAVLADLRVYMDDYSPTLPSILDLKVILADQSGGAAGTLGAQAEVGKLREEMRHDPAVERLAGRFTQRFEDILRRLFVEQPDDETGGPIALDLYDSRAGRAYMLFADAVKQVN